MWSQVATSRGAADDALQPMCSNDLLSYEAGRSMSPDHHCDPDDNWEVPINGGFP